MQPIMIEYLYLLHCSDGSFFTGSTDDLDKSISDHIEGKDPHHYTFSRRPVKLVFSEKVLQSQKGGLTEEQLKNWSRKKKPEILSRPKTKDIAK